MLPGWSRGRQFPPGHRAVTNGLQGLISRGASHATLELPGRPGELPFVALQFLVHPSPQGPGAAAPYRVTIEGSHWLRFTRGGRDPHLIGSAQLRLADRLYAPGDGGPGCEFLDRAAGSPGQDAMRIGRHQLLAAEHHVHRGRGGLGELALAQQDGFARCGIHRQLPQQHVGEECGGFDVTACPARIGSGYAADAFLEEVSGWRGAGRAEGEHGARDERADYGAPFLARVRIVHADAGEAAPEALGVRGETEWAAAVYRHDLVD